MPISYRLLRDPLELVRIDELLMSMQCAEYLAERSKAAKDCADELNAAYAAYMDAREDAARAWSGEPVSAPDPARPWATAQSVTDAARSDARMRAVRAGYSTSPDDAASAQARAAYNACVCKWVARARDLMEKAQARKVTKGQANAISAMFDACRKHGAWRCTPEIMTASAMCARHLGACRELADALHVLGASESVATVTATLDAWNKRDWDARLGEVLDVLEHASRNDIAPTPATDLPKIIDAICLWLPGE